MKKYKFKPASNDEDIVYGAQRPGYDPFGRKVDNKEVVEWIRFMKSQGIKKVVVLLSEDELIDFYDKKLLIEYREEFGDEDVLWSPIEDHHLVDETALRNEIIPFLKNADKVEKSVVVHCSYGSGRTGHVLALWLNHGRGYEMEDALQIIYKTGRNPEEALKNEPKEKLYSLFKK